MKPHIVTLTFETAQEASEFLNKYDADLINNILPEEHAPTCAALYLQFEDIIELHNYIREHIDNPKMVSILHSLANNYRSLVKYGDGSIDYNINLNNIKKQLNFENYPEVEKLLNYFLEFDKDKTIELIDLVQTELVEKLRQYFWDLCSEQDVDPY